MLGGTDTRDQVAMLTGLHLHTPLLSPSPNTVAERVLQGAGTLTGSEQRQQQ